MPLASAPAKPPRRLAFLGTPDLAVTPLRALVDAGFEVPIVVSQPDRRRGRGGGLTPSPVKAAATAIGLPVTDRVSEVTAAGVELGVVVAFGRIIPSEVLAELPMVNLHFSLLPRWRGAAPVQRAILAGDVRTGVDVMAVEEGLDTGGIYRRAELAIGPDDTADDLTGQLVTTGTALLMSALTEGLGVAVPQQGEPTYAAKIAPAELHVDWTQPRLAVHRLVRVGGAWTTHRGKRLKLWRTHVPPREHGPQIAAGDGPLELVEVQPAGKAPMSGSDWAKGARWRPGEPLGT